MPGGTLRPRTFGASIIVPPIAWSTSTSARAPYGNNEMKKRLTDRSSLIRSAFFDVICEIQGRDTDRDDRSESESESEESLVEHACIISFLESANKLAP